MEATRGSCLSIFAALLALVALAFGGGKSSPLDSAATLIQFHGPGENNERNFNGMAPVESFEGKTLIAGYRPEYDPDLAPAPTWPLAATMEATPTPVAAIAPTVTAAAVDGSDRPQCPAVIVATFGEHAPAACAIAWCESRYNPLASGDGGVSLGLFQVNTGWHGPSGPNGWASWAGIEPEALYDPAVNADVARRIWAYSGYTWRAWTCAAKVGLS